MTNTCTSNCVEYWCSYSFTHFTKQHLHAYIKDVKTLVPQAEQDENSTDYNNYEQSSSMKTFKDQIESNTA